MPPHPLPRHPTLPFTYRMSSDDALYFYKFSWTYLYSGNKTTSVKLQREITPKICRQEWDCLWFAHHLMMLYISAKFHENIKRISTFFLYNGYKTTIVKFILQKYIYKRHGLLQVIWCFMLLWSFMKIPSPVSICTADTQLLLSKF